MKASTERVKKARAKAMAMLATIVGSGVIPREEKAIYADDLGADLALLLALGFDPSTHVLRPRMGNNSEQGLEVLRENGTRADFFTHKSLKLKKRDPAFMRRWAEARGLDG